MKIYKDSQGLWYVDNWLCQFCKYTINGTTIKVIPPTGDTISSDVSAIVKSDNTFFKSTSDFVSTCGDFFYKDISIPTGSLVDPANYLYVAKNGSDINNGSAELPYLTIQAAINAATSGTTVFVFPGTYNENITFKAGVNISSPIKFGVTISGNHVANYEGTVVLDNITLTSSTGITLTMSGTTTENFQLIGSSIVSVTDNAIYWSNTSASSKIYFEDGTCTTVGGSAFGCFASASTAKGSVIANRVTFSMTNKQYVAINLAGAISFTHTSDVVNGEILVANTSSYIGQLVALAATGVPCLSTTSSGISLLFACTLTSTVTPVQGAGGFYYSALSYGSTGVGAATTLNGGIGATPLPLSSLQIRQAPVRPTAYDGMMEYDGTHLYFTIGTTRHTII